MWLLLKETYFKWSADRASRLAAALAFLLQELATFTGDGIWIVVHFAAALAIVTILFALMFKWLPDADVRWGDVWLAAFVTSIFFNLGKIAVGFYLGRAAVASAYGAAGSFVILLIWIYYAAQILFFGAEFTQVYAKRRAAAVPVAA